MRKMRQGSSRMRNAVAHGRRLIPAAGGDKQSRRLKNNCIGVATGVEPQHRVKLSSPKIERQMMKSRNRGLTTLQKFASGNRMKAKIVLRFLSALVLSSLLSGCLFTHATVRENYGSQVQTDTFSPTTIYKSSNDGGIALEGIWDHNGKQAHAYLIIPETVFLEAHNNTKGDVSLDDIQRLPPEVRKTLQLEKQLPKGYEKVADLKNNGGGVVLSSTNQEKVRVGKIGMVPFAFVADVATFPLQVLFLSMLPKWQ